MKTIEAMLFLRDSALGDTPGREDLMQVSAAVSAVAFAIVDPPVGAERAEIRKLALTAQRAVESAKAADSAQLKFRGFGNSRPPGGDSNGAKGARP